MNNTSNLCYNKKQGSRIGNKTSDPGWIALCLIHVDILVCFCLLFMCCSVVFTTQTPLQPSLAGSRELLPFLRAVSQNWKPSLEAFAKWQPQTAIRWTTEYLALCRRHLKRTQNYFSTTHQEANLNKTAGHLMHFWRYFHCSSSYPSIHPSSALTKCI